MYVYLYHHHLSTHVHSRIHMHSISFLNRSNERVKCFLQLHLQILECTIEKSLKFLITQYRSSTTVESRNYFSELFNESTKHLVMEIHI